MKRFLAGILLYLILLGVLIEPGLHYWAIVSSLLLISLSIVYLLSSKASQLVHRLLRVKNVTPLKRWAGALMVLYLGIAFIINDYRESALKEQAHKTHSEIQDLITSAQSSIAKKDTDQAIVNLRKAILVQGASQEDKDRAWSLFQQCKDAISDYKVGQVLNGMTEEQFAAFNKNGPPPSKTFFSDPNLNEVFLETLKRNRTRAEELRDAERTRLRVEGERRQVEQALLREKERVRAEADEQRKYLEENPDTFVTKEGYMFGVTYEAFVKSQEYLAQKDQAALEQLVATGLVGQLKPGMYIYIVDTRKQKVPILGIMVTGVVKIRPVGVIAEVWTNVEAVKR